MDRDSQNGEDFHGEMSLGKWHHLVASFSKAWASGDN